MASWTTNRPLPASLPHPARPFAKRESFLSGQGENRGTRVRSEVAHKPGGAESCWRGRKHGPERESGNQENQTFASYVSVSCFPDPSDSKSGWRPAASQVSDPQAPPPADRQGISSRPTKSDWAKQNTIPQNGSATSDRTRGTPSGVLRSRPDGGHLGSVPGPGSPRGAPSGLFDGRRLGRLFTVRSV